MSLSLKVLLATLLAALATAAPAAATSAVGQYDAWSCHNGDDHPVPVTGWVLSHGLGFGGQDSSCTNGGDLGVNFTGNSTNYHNGDVDSWTFHPPAGTTLGGATLTRGWGVTRNAPDTDYVSASIYLYSGGNDYVGNKREECRSDMVLRGECYITPQSDITIPGGGDNTIMFQAGCTGGGGTNDSLTCQNSPDGRASFYVHRARITLNDATAPALVGAIGGSITGGGALTGTQSVNFEATDAGSGVLATQLSIDGKAGAVTAIDAGDKVCTLAGRDTGFDAVVPCKGDVTPQLSVNTAGLAAGSHNLVVTVIDAAGNSKNLPSVNFTTAAQASPTPGANPGPGAPAPLGPANGTTGDLGTATLVPAKKSKILNGRVGRTTKITGHLVDGSGHPIAGALIDVRRTVALPGAPTTIVSTVKTNAVGGYAYVFKPTSSSTIVLAYATHVASTDYVSQSTVDVHAKAAVSLRLSRTRASVGQLVRFTGTVTVDPQPIGGARVLIEARSGSHWVLAAAKKTDKKGHFSYAHRFGHGGSYRFRARVLQATDLAARSGTSALKSLHVG